MDNLTLDAFELPELPEPTGRLYSNWQQRIANVAEAFHYPPVEAVLSKDLQQSLYWGYRLCRAMETSPFVRGIPAGVRYAAGNLQSMRGTPQFGAVVFTSSGIGLPYDPLEIGILEAEGEAFPVVIAPASITPHLAATQPVLGTAGCWGRSRVSSPNPIGPGLLTAEHVLDEVAKTVALDNGYLATMLDRGLGITDLALISCNAAPSTFNPLAIMPYPAVGMPVTIETKAQVVNTRIQLVSHDFGLHGVAQIPSRSYVVPHGQAGDSGALVTAGDLVVGFYLAQFTDQAGHSWGDVQNADQVCQMMDMELMT